MIKPYRTVFYTIILFLVLVTPLNALERRPVENEFEEKLDKNHDGFLDEREVNKIAELLRQALTQPHDVQNPVDRLIDKNKDGFVDPHEIKLAKRSYLPVVIGTPRRVYNDFEMLLDLNGSGFLEDYELEEIGRFLMDPDLHKPRRSNNTPLDRKLDDNHNGTIEKKEIGQAIHLFFKIIIWERIYLIQKVVMHPEELELLENALHKGPHRVENHIDEFLDRNHNGKVDAQEIEGGKRFLEEQLAAQSTEHGAPILTVLDEITDINGNGVLDDFELELREKSFHGPHQVKNKFDKRIDFNQNRKIERFEIDKAKHLGGHRLEIATLHDDSGKRHRASTEADKILDLNRDNIIEQGEIQRALDFFIIGPHAVDRDFTLDKMADMNKDNFIDEHELVKAREKYFRPHPVRDSFDKKLDKNRDNFVDEAEIGIAAGFSHGEDEDPDAENLSFDEMIEAMHIQKEILSQEETEASSNGTHEEATTSYVEVQKKLNSLKGKTIAIVELSTQAADESTSNFILDSTSNAFVNIAVVSVIEKNKLDEVIKEQGFQLSDLTDESTAVQVGKLSNADYIVLGSLYKVGDKYYLNIKLISVESGIVTGSSMSTAEKEDDFYTMCNDAVYKLF